MKKSETIAELTKALAKFQGEVENPSNTAVNPFYKAKYAPLETVLSTVRPILSKYGLSIVQAPSGDGSNIIVTTTLFHESGEYMEFPELVLKADKPTAQGAGSAITYGRRYALSAILGISSEDDDDGNIAEPKQNKKPKMTSNANGNRSDLASPKQIELITNLAKRKNYELEKITAYIKKEFEKNSSKELTKQEASKLIEMLNRLGKQ